MQRCGPAAGRTGAQAQHDRARGPKEAHEEQRERNHRQTEGETCKALAVGEGRVVEPVQCGDEAKWDEDSRKPAQCAGRCAEGRLVPAEVSYGHAAPVQKPRKRGNCEQKLRRRQARIAESQGEGLAIGRMQEHRSGRPENEWDGYRQREGDRERCDSVADPVPLVGNRRGRNRREPMQQATAQRK